MVQTADACDLTVVLEDVETVFHRLFHSHLWEFDRSGRGSDL